MAASSQAYAQEELSGLRTSFPFVLVSIVMGAKLWANKALLLSLAILPLSLRKLIEENED